MPRILTAESTNNGNVPQDFEVEFMIGYDGEGLPPLDEEDIVAGAVVLGELLPGESGQVTWNWSARKYASYMYGARVTAVDEKIKDLHDNEIWLYGEDALVTRIKIFSDSSESIEPVTFKDGVPWDYQGSGNFWSGNNVTGTEAAGWHRVGKRADTQGFNSVGAWYVGEWTEDEGEEPRYAAGMVSSIESSSVDISDEEEVTLSFMTKFRVEGWSYDNMEVWIKAGGQDWTRIDRYPYKDDEPDTPDFDLKDSTTYRDNNEGWILKEYSIPSLFQQSDFQVRFTFRSDQGAEFEGVYIDDITLHAKTSVENHAPVPRFIAYSQGHEGYSTHYVDDFDYKDSHFAILSESDKERLTHLPTLKGEDAIQGGLDISQGFASVVFDATYAFDPDQDDEVVTYKWEMSDPGTGNVFDTIFTDDPILVYVPESESPDYSDPDGEVRGFVEMPQSGEDYYLVTLFVSDDGTNFYPDAEDSTAEMDEMEVYIGNREPIANFSIFDIGGNKEKLVEVETKDYLGVDTPVYEVYWGDNIKFQSEAEDPENRDKPGKGISNVKWDFLYEGDFNEQPDVSEAESVTLTVGQGDYFIYDTDHCMKEDGIPIFYENGWDLNLPAEYSYLKSIVNNAELPEAGNTKIFLPPPMGDEASELLYPVRFTAVDDQLATSHNVILLRVKPFTRASFYHEVEDEHGNYFTAEATLTWRGDYEEAADSSKNINKDSPVFVYINDTTHPQGLPENGELGIYYEVAVIGTTMQDPTRYGFVDLEVKLPYSADSLEAVGITSVLEQKVKVYYWEQRSYSFEPLATKTEPRGGVYFATATIDDELARNNMPLAPLVYSLYESEADLAPEEPDRAELEVQEIIPSRYPALPGEPVTITVKMRNTGTVHAIEVPFRISVNSVEFYANTVDLYAGAEEPATVTATYSVTSDIQGVALYEVSVLLDPHHEVPEKDRDNNLEEIELYVVQPKETVSSFAASAMVMVTTLVILVSLVTIRERRISKKKR